MGSALHPTLLPHIWPWLVVILEAQYIFPSTETLEFFALLQRTLGTEQSEL